MSIDVSKGLLWNVSSLHCLFTASGQALIKWMGMADYLKTKKNVAIAYAFWYVESHFLPVQKLSIPMRNNMFELMLKQFQLADNQASLFSWQCMCNALFRCSLRKLNPSNVCAVIAVLTISICDKTSLFLFFFFKLTERLAKRIQLHFNYVINCNT